MTRNLGWIGLAAFVIIYDVWAVLTEAETLTGGFIRWLRNPVTRGPLVAVWSIVTLHLFDLLPRQIDPFSHGLRMMRVVTKRRG